MVQTMKLSSILLVSSWLLSSTNLSAQAPTTLPLAQVSVVMSGLDNPRGLAFGPEGALYVAEAGRGGGGPCRVSPLGVRLCYGPSGALTRLWHGAQRRIVMGLPSYVSPAGDATGPHDVSFQDGSAYITIGLGANPAVRSAFGAVGPLFGTLVQTASRGRWHVIADVSAYETAANPDRGLIDTNPYGLLARPGERIIADAGANALLRVASDGSISTLAVFPPTPPPIRDSVPTAVAVGPDGAYYVGELTGAPFLAGTARVFRVVPGAPPQVFLQGFKTIIDLDFGPDGSLYVLQYAALGVQGLGGPGNVTRVAPNGARSLVAIGLSQPTSLVVGRDGSIYVSNRGSSVGIGEVLRIEP